MYLSFSPVTFAHKKQKPETHHVEVRRSEKAYNLNSDGGLTQGGITEAIVATHKTTGKQRVKIREGARDPKQN